jgi:hypothetical protein
VAGAVTFDGTVPAGEVVDMSTAAFCHAANGGQPAVKVPVVVNADGGLRHVIVYVKEGLAPGGYATPDETALLNQENCRYVPHVVGMQTGQTLVIRNSDATLHNVHAFAQNNRGFNVGQPLKGVEAKRRFPNPEVGISVKCDVHGWMQAYVAVFEHPFFALTGEDGAFELGDLPPGDYVLEAWHETLGTQAQAITVTTGQDVDVSFTFAG